MVTDRAITVTAFSREERRRASQAQRTGRGFTPPGPGQPKKSGGCCIFLILLVVAIIVYAYVDAYWLSPQREQQRKEEKSSVSSVIVTRLDGSIMYGSGKVAVVMVPMSVLELPYLVPVHITGRPNWTGTQIG